MTILERECFKYRCWCSFYNYNPKEAKSLKVYIKLKGCSISRKKENNVKNNIAVVK